VARIPALGPKGEGWVAIQVVLFVLIGALGAINLPEARPGPIGVVVVAIGIGLGLVSALVVLSGLRGLGPSLSARPYPAEGGRLVRDGVYARIRHPIYAGVMGLALAWSCITLSLPALALSIVLVIVLDLKARLEETWLAERYPDYAAYARQTHRFVPRLY
jgi:protein-S-isoprenylcysteine O-methyltransferase Ste14